MALAIRSFVNKVLTFYLILGYRGLAICGFAFHFHNILEPNPLEKRGKPVL